MFDGQHVSAITETTHKPESGTGTFYVSSGHDPLPIALLATIKIGRTSETWSRWGEHLSVAPPRQFVTCPTYFKLKPQAA